jgi:hypothetical protein
MARPDENTMLLQFAGNSAASMNNAVRHERNNDK